jgi:hypothetical protein
MSRCLSTNQPRQASGTPVGGQWSAKVNPESEIDLDGSDGRSEWIPDDDYFLTAAGEPEDPSIPEPAPTAQPEPPAQPEQATPSTFMAVEDLEPARLAVQAVMDAAPGSPEQQAAARAAEKLVTEVGTKVAQQIDMLCAAAEAKWLSSPIEDEQPDGSFPHNEANLSLIRQESTKFILGQLRDFGLPGGETIPLATSSQKPAVAVLNTVSGRFPRAWLTANSANTDRYPLSARVSPGRAHYSPARAKWEKVGKVERRQRYESYPVSMVPKDAIDISYETAVSTGQTRATWTVVRQVAQKVQQVVAEITLPSPSRGIREAERVGTHEISHRLEDTNPHLFHLERAFLDRRCVDENGRPTRLRYLPRSRSEKVQEGGFTDPYVGKWYGSQFTEVLSTGTEAVYCGSYGGLVGDGGDKPDPDHRAFVLGMLAVG